MASAYLGRASGPQSKVSSVDLSYVEPFDAGHLSGLSPARRAAWRPNDDALAFPRADGGPWRRHDYQNWRRRIFTPAAELAGLRRSTPYDLRHAFCSLLIRGGRDPVEVADQAGNSAKLVLDTYGHVFREMRGAERVSAEAAIKAARAGHVSAKCPRHAAAGTA
jgi:integrase